MRANVYVIMRTRPTCRSVLKYIFFGRESRLERPPRRTYHSDDLLPAPPRPRAPPFKFIGPVYVIITFVRNITRVVYTYIIYISYAL